ncbi:uncharacterized protein LOC129880536 isoform X2 [Solanum dulcamara]|uniref:uncharacterized protein LOC129880536 isoform X2 n=1 Tax=Solanum dulcamara TaxID=45834 RepID=UPI002485063E|nr:uncharacterized protein LOC129880536 isoform X2 [Solanum dulcamara]
MGLRLKILIVHVTSRHFLFGGVVVPLLLLVLLHMASWDCLKATFGLLSYTISQASGALIIFPLIKVLGGKEFEAKGQMTLTVILFVAKVVLDIKELELIRLMPIECHLLVLILYFLTLQIKVWVFTTDLDIIQRNSWIFGDLGELLTIGVAYLPLF